MPIMPKGTDILYTQQVFITKNRTKENRTAENKRERTNGEECTK